MAKYLQRRKWFFIAALALAPVLAAWQLSVAFADAPQPNPVPGATANLNANGPAATMHGDPLAGRSLFAQNCAACHGVLGTGGVDNTGSDDGTVPPVSPIDPGFLEDSNGDPAIFARNLDLFMQHGSRPAGDNPRVSMPNWGDKNLLSQKQIADIEAYVMELNGIYWPDKWSPPAEVQMKASRDGDTVTYQIVVVNHGVGLGTLDLKDTLPAGLTYVTSYAVGPGQNPGNLSGSTVQWTNSDGVPQGASVGPFVVVAKANGPTVPPNAAQLFFQWTGWDGTIYQSSAVSEQVVPSQPAQPAAGPSTSPAPAPQAPATASPAPSAPAPAPVNVAAQIVEPSSDITSWGYGPATITIHVGDRITWTNTGSMPHTVTADDGSFDSGTLNNGGTWSYTFTSPGTYTYHCAPHPWMKGTVIVQNAGQ
ncbi:MAG: plastocyanin/azurin family copper-binding protein [Chloroflexi bacterium]|nr:plastocyanin/azurin family copper-binding protein [Chloroflexota bacterium]